MSWEVYNQTSGMVLCALLPCIKSDADWPHPGYKPRSEAFKETGRWFMHWSLSIIFESAREASFTGFEMKDPEGVVHNAVPFIHVISKDLGEASAISGVRSSACDSCLVPTDELHLLKKANQGGYAPRLEDNMWCTVQEMQRHKNARAPHARILELNREHGIHFIEVLFDLRVHSLRAVVFLPCAYKCRHLALLTGDTARCALVFNSDTPRWQCLKLCANCQSCRIAHAFIPTLYSP